MLVEKKTTSSEADSGCFVSKLEIYDIANTNGNNTGTLIPEPTHLFCGESAPHLCAHAADYPPMYLPPRPCEVSINFAVYLPAITLLFPNNDTIRLVNIRRTHTHLKKEKKLKFIPAMHLCLKDHCHGTNTKQIFYRISIISHIIQVTNITL